MRTSTRWVRSGAFSRSRTLLAALAAAAALAAGCGGDGNGGSGNEGAELAAGADPAIAAQVPQEIRDRGTLTLATDAGYPPNEFVDSDGRTIVGMDIDLANALGEVLGLRIEPVNVQFDAILPGLASGRYDLGMSSFTDTREREEVVDFVTYFSAGTSFFTRAEGGVEIAGLADLCGRTVAVQNGTVQYDDATAQSEKCAAEGRPAVTVIDFPDQNGANLAVVSGRADLSMADSPVADYQVKLSEGRLVSTGEPYGTAPYGIAVPKDSGLAEPLLAALKKIMADGTYQQILDNWGVGAGAITDPKINGAID